MENTIFKSVLKEYEQKKLRAELDLDQRVRDLYSSNKRLSEINDELNSTAVKISKSILLSNDASLITKLKNSVEILQKEKDGILRNLGIDEQFFKPAYACSICNDTGYVQLDLNTTMCNCLKQKLFDIEYNKSNLGNLKFENFDTFNLNLYSNEADPKRFKSSISPRENIEIIKDLAVNFVEDFDNPISKNLLFMGTPGLGKTFLSNCIANELLKKGRTVLYQTAPIMLDSIIDYKFGKSNGSSDIYNSLLNVDLLIIDDLGTESMNSVKFSELFNIINSRLLNQYNKITKTIISTNLTMQELFINYDERIVSRIRGYYKVCPFFGDDIRIYPSSSTDPK